MNSKNRKLIKVDHLARVEGEGAMWLQLRGGKVEDVKLKIFEPPRFFEAFLRGRNFAEAPDITARICGICPVAYQMSAVHAMEHAAGVSVGDQIRLLRRLLYCGEWVESHALHVYMLHAPDFLSYESAVHMARDHAEIVQRGLRLKKAGNSLMQVIGGREIHPVNVCVGGFYSWPDKAELHVLMDELAWAREAAIETVRWVAGFEFPDFEQDYTFVSLRHAEEYPMNDGRIVSNRGLDIDAADFEQYFSEEQVPHSNALHCKLRDEGAYMVGPMARYNLNYDRLHPEVQALAGQTGLPYPCHNPFQSIIIRGIEMVQALTDAIALIQSYEPEGEAAVDVQPQNTHGMACTEAPRGILYHYYDVDEKKLIRKARIIPPTSQNQKRIEEDLLGFVPGIVQLPDDQISWKCEQMIRNYDPCISCATHFLKLEVDRR